MKGKFESSILRETKLILKWICHGAISKREGKATRQQFSYWEETKLREEQQKLLPDLYFSSNRQNLRGGGRICIHRRTRKTSRGINYLGLLFYRLNICPNITWTDRQENGNMDSIWKHKGFDGVFLVLSEKNQFPLYSLFRRLKFLCV